MPYRKYEDIKIINPYNFVRSNFDKIERPAYSDEKEQQKLYGKIVCKAKIKSDLIIPDPKPEKETLGSNKTHNAYSLLYLGNEILIPGSAIRGVIRSAFEAATDSCYITSGDADQLHTRDVSSKQPGLLGWDSSGNLCLYEAKRYMLLSKNYPKFSSYQTYYSPSYPSGTIAGGTVRYQTGDEVRFNPVLDAYRSEKEYTTVNNGRRINTGAYMVKDIDPAGTHTGYILVGEDFGRKKHHESIIVPVCDSRGRLKIVSTGPKLETAIENYKYVIKLYNDSSLNKKLTDRRNPRNDWYHDLSTKVNDFLNSKTGFFPVFYILSSGNLRISPGQLSRSVLETTEIKHLKEKRPCTDRNELCPACTLFGMIDKNGDENSNSRGSRIRISDGRLERGSIEIGKRTLPELASPRPSYMLSYSNSDDPGKTYDDNNVEFRGRKFYWHRDIRDRNATKSSLNGTYEYIKCTENTPVIPFELYFDGITQEQLNDILWVITLGENKQDGVLCHHLGHGKPLGYGSVKITADAVVIRDTSDGWSVIKKEGREIDSFIRASNIPYNYRDQVNDLKAISQFNPWFKQYITYPYVVDETGNRNEGNRYASHQWFSQMKIWRNRRKFPSISDCTKNTSGLMPIFQFYDEDDLNNLYSEPINEMNQSQTAVVEKEPVRNEPVTMESAKNTLLERFGDKHKKRKKKK